MTMFLRSECTSNIFTAFHDLAALVIEAENAWHHVCSAFCSFQRRSDFFLVADATGLAALTGREAGGVRGIKLKDGDYVVGAGKVSDGKYVLTVTENGFGKMTECEEFREAHRSTQGVRVHNLTEKTGQLCSLKVVSGDEDMIIINSAGVVIRTSVKGVRICARASQGVYLIRLEEDVKVISVTTTAAEEEENTAETVENPVENVEN